MLTQSQLMELTSKLPREEVAKINADPDYGDALYEFMKSDQAGFVIWLSDTNNQLSAEFIRDLRERAKKSKQRFFLAAAVIASAGVAAAFFGPAAGAATGSAASSSALTGVALPTGVAPIAASPSLTATAASLGLDITGGLVAPGALLSMPAFSGAAAAITSPLLSSLSSPAMQSAIAAGTVAAPPSSLLASGFKDWALSTGMNLLDSEIGAQLTAGERAEAEAAMVAEIERLQAELARRGVDYPFDPQTQLSQEALATIEAAQKREKLMTIGLVSLGAVVVLGVAMR